MAVAARAGDEALVLTLARELFALEQQRLAVGTIPEYFKRVEAELRVAQRGR